MAGLAGGKYITFEKPYLNMVSDLIASKKKIVVGGTSQVINTTPEITQFLDAIDSLNSSKISSILKPGSRFATIFNGWKWSDIDKSQFTTTPVPTDLQELGSLFAIQKSIENKKVYKDKEEFFKLYRDDLLKIYPDMNELWEDTYFQQQLTVRKELVRELGASKINKIGHYSRDVGFMDYITKFVNNRYGISRKDTWNPADIWLVSDLSKMKKLLTDRIVDNVTSLEQFNTLLRELFGEGKIIGISLKKMSGKSAQWELVNLKNMDIYDTNEYSFKLKLMSLDFSMKNINEFKNTDSKILLEGKTKNMQIQIRQNSTGFNNLKVEGTDITARSARLGKSPLDMISTLFNSMGLNFDNKHQNYPTNESEYINSQNKWEGKFKSLPKKYTDIASSTVFSKNMIAVYNSNRPDFASSKLMQLNFLVEILKLNNKDKDVLLTTIIYLAQKKGKIFGPFGKLY
jgi:hypothetical protein